MYRIIVINPGSTSTKLAFFEDDKEQYTDSLSHSREELLAFSSITDQFDFRAKFVENFIQKNKIKLDQVDAFVGRGGLLRPVESGTYRVDSAMLHDLKVGIMGEHASNLGGILADYFAAKVSKPAYIVDPVVVDELDDVSRFSGHPAIPRKSIFHALNQKAVARRVANELGIKYEELNLIVAHLGGGISIAAHKKGRIVDVNDALEGDGPFSPERTGGLPVGDLVRLCFSGKYSKKEIFKQLRGQGGLVAYLGTNSVEEVQRKIAEGDPYARDIYKAMIIQVSKSIAALSAIFQGNVDAIILTGGICNDDNVVNSIKQNVSFIAVIYVIPGEKELQALAAGALRILRGEENEKSYEGTHRI